MFLLLRLHYAALNSGILQKEPRAAELSPLNKAAERRNLFLGTRVDFVYRTLGRLTFKIDFHVKTMCVHNDILWVVLAESLSTVKHLDDMRTRESLPFFFKLFSITSDKIAPNVVRSEKNS